MSSLYELYLLYVRERRGTVAALFLLSMLGTVSLFAVFLFWQLGESIAGDIQRALGARTIVVMGGPFSDRDLAAALRWVASQRLRRLGGHRRVALPQRHY
jgi:hypothetical protein